MRRVLALTVGTLALLGAAQALAEPATPPDPTIRAKGWTPPKTAWGRPDISGQWSNATLTPLTRNPRISDKSKLTPAEARSMEKI